MQGVCVRLSELRGRELINLLDGERLGLFGELDLGIDPQTGRIEELRVPARRGLWLGRAEVVIPWSCVRRIGPEVVLVEVEPGDRRPLSRGRS